MLFQTNKKVIFEIEETTSNFAGEDTIGLIIDLSATMFYIISLDFKKGFPLIWSLSKELT